MNIFAQMAALELSIDKDWLRHKLSFFYASGDKNPTNSQATGFDTILDRPFFIGGPFSFYVHQGFNLGGTAVNFKQRDSLVPNFRSSKTEGQANFVNPGAVIVGYGADAEVTPKLKAFFNVNYIWTATTEPTQPRPLHQSRQQRDRPRCQPRRAMAAAPDRQHHRQRRLRRAHSGRGLQGYLPREHAAGAGFSAGGESGRWMIFYTAGF